MFSTFSFQKLKRVAYLNDVEDAGEEFFLESYAAILSS
jgi:hypothetical protein